MRHRNIARLFETIDTNKQMFLVMEHVNGPSLHSYVKKKPDRRLAEQEAKQIFIEIMQGIQYLHHKKVTHRDIKLENILLDQEKSVKIIDFGFSTCMSSEKKMRVFCGTPSYMAPEIVVKKEYRGPPVDI